MKLPPGVSIPDWVKNDTQFEAYIKLLRTLWHRKQVEKAHPLARVEKARHLAKTGAVYFEED